MGNDTKNVAETKEPTECGTDMEFSFGCLLLPVSSLTLC